MGHEGTTRLDYFTRAITVPASTGVLGRSHQVAGAGGRFLAGFIDFLLQLLGFAVLAWIAARYRPDMFPKSSWVWTVPVAFVEWHIIYMMLFESFTRGITPGKALVGLRVTGKHGDAPRPTAFVVRNMGRLFDLALLGYLGSLFVVYLNPRRQRLGDKLAGTVVIYSQPLSLQLEAAAVPESLYSTSEDGYLLEAWIGREQRLDEESRSASSADLAAYLHTKYGDAREKSKDPMRYLHELYEQESQASDDGGGVVNERNSASQPVQ